MKSMFDFFPSLCLFSNEPLNAVIKNEITTEDVWLTVFSESISNA